MGSLKRTVTALAITSLVVLALTPPVAVAEQRVLRADQAVARPCHAALLAGGTPGTDRREVRSTVDGLVHARLREREGPGGDWDVAVFAKADGRVVAASSALRSQELAEGAVKKDQVLVVQACRYGGAARTVTLGLDFLAVPPVGPAERAELVRVETPRQADKGKLMGLGLDVTEKADATGVVVVLNGDDDRKKLRDSGMGYQVVDADLAKTTRAYAEADKAYASRTASSTLPSGRTSYRTLYEVNYELKELARRNPALAKAVTAPHPTLEGRDVVGLEIARDVANSGDGRPVFFLMGAHHAREWPTVEHSVEWAYELINGYGADAEIRSLVDRTRNLIVPVVNPDGFSVSREGRRGDSGDKFAYEWKRKNCSVHDSPPEYRTGVCAGNPAGWRRGVDPNRNYGGFWGGAGAEMRWDGEGYRGPGPFSEPESRNIRDMVSTRQVTNLITLHTFSNLVLRPPGNSDVQSSADEPAYKALGDKMASRNGYVSQRIWELYTVSGGTEDWSYWATGGFGFTFEIGHEHFHPAYANAVVAEYTGTAPAAGAGKGGNRRAFLDMLGNTADASAHSTVVGSAPRGYQLKLRKSFQTPTSPVVQPDGGTTPPIYYTDRLESTLTAPGGRFEWAVNPSTRPYVGDRIGRTPLAPAQPGFALANPPGMPPVNPAFPADPAAERIPFTIKGLPQHDNGQVRVTVSSRTANGDWDVYILDEDGHIVGASATDPLYAGVRERAVLLDPVPGDYTLAVVNYGQADPANPEDWSGAVEFVQPQQPVHGTREAYTLTCADRSGNLVGTRDVFVDRGQTTDVTGVCEPARRGRR
ncbi:peptidase M14 [Actinosynnema sp. ALI-1.44]|uniref:M14 family zinc carboxypeptidase n=1 Tax=Actinosynnema sp. ALI-1.44 TaxID=1933779 RepID=UPI00097BC36A|nr:M14 family zinc carboxypeptidase [Actinosynnema sp. ALI-1.44]ONI71293.1 peptidase M14 [Actinosynnema sp. ALI-1.44]